MSALNLPKPVNTYAGEDELRKAASPANGAANGENGDAPAQDEGEYVAPKPSDRFKAGLIYPPREVRCEHITPPSSPSHVDSSNHRQDRAGHLEIAYTVIARRQDPRTTKR